MGRGGRQHGKAEGDIDKFCGKATVSPDIAGRTTIVNVTVRVTGIVTKRVGIDSDDAIGQSGLVVNLPEEENAPPHWDATWGRAGPACWIAGHWHFDLTAPVATASFPQWLAVMGSPISLKTHNRSRTPTPLYFLSFS